MTTTINENPATFENMKSLLSSCKKYQPKSDHGINFHVLISNSSRLDFIDPDKDSRRVKIIIHNVCEQMGVSQSEILTRKTRLSQFVFSRMLIAYFIRKHTDLTLKGIAAAMWKGSGPHRHHTTIIHSCRICQDMVDSHQSRHDFYNVFMKLSSIFDEMSAGSE